MAGRYDYSGNLLYVEFPNMGWKVMSQINWINPTNRASIRSTVVSSNIPNSPGPGTNVDFSRSR